MRCMHEVTKFDGLQKLVFSEQAVSSILPKRGVCRLACCEITRVQSEVELSACGHQWCH